jgi:transketolase
VVGLAIAEKHASSEFNKSGFDMINSYSYCIFGDGFAIESVAGKAASAAGHLQLD